MSGQPDLSSQKKKIREWEYENKKEIRDIEKAKYWERYFFPVSSCEQHADLKILLFCDSMLPGQSPFFGIASILFVNAGYHLWCSVGMAVAE